MSRRLDEALLAGPKDTTARLTLRADDGGERDVTLPRNTIRWQRPQRTYPVFGVLPEEVGYIDLQRLTVPQVDEAFDAVKGAPGLIFDMRGYPKGTAWAIAPRLTDKEVVTARFEAVQLSGFEWWMGMRGTRTFDQRTTPSPQWRYRGKVVVLIDGTAISQAEHTCLFLEASTDVTFVGSPTNGANGDITNVVLPGDVVVGFSGQAVRPADGRQLQRFGIQPHVWVALTRAGLRAGRDEVLEAGIRVLREWVEASG
jgi:C-terminal processing protease CtpA/Prc